VNRFTGEFKSAEVKIYAGKRLKLNSERSNLDVMKAEEVIAKSTGGTLHLGTVDAVDLNAAGTKCEIQDVSESLRADTRWGRLEVRSINHQVSTVEVTASDTKVALAFRPGGGFNMNFKHNNMKIDIPGNFLLEKKPTMNKRVFIESGFIGDKQFDSQVSLNITGGEIIIQ
jgi:hypothetical protein